MSIYRSMMKFAHVSLLRLKFVPVGESIAISTLLFGLGTYIETAPMLKTKLLQIIAHGESSRVEFKRDDVRPEQLAKEIVALINFQGGQILLGIEDNGAISGLQRSDTEEWVMNGGENDCRTALQS